jgi:pyridoxal phosphate enzyme (YggS family)
VSVPACEIADRLKNVKDEIAECALRAGRDSTAVRLVAVSKYASVAQIRAAADAGQSEFGENYVVAGLQKIEALGDRSLRWHMVGQLQSNKAAKAALGFQVIESLSSIRCAAAISRVMQAQGEARSCLLQIRLDGHAGRGGVEPEAAGEMASQIASLPGIVLDGVMGVAPVGEAPGPHFARLRELCEKLRAQDMPSAPMTEISAGMSTDFTVAIAEGATSVRIGRAIFGEKRAQR